MYTYYCTCMCVGIIVLAVVLLAAISLAYSFAVKSRAFLESCFMVGRLVIDHNYELLTLLLHIFVVYCMCCRHKLCSL